MVIELIKEVNIKNFTLTLTIKFFTLNFFQGKYYKKIWFKIKIRFFEILESY